jgi:hypothetical protein
MKKNIIIISIISLFANVLITYFGRGSFGHVIIILSSIIWIALPVLAISIVLLIIGKKLQNKKTVYFSLRGGTISLIIISTAISLPFGGLLRVNDIRDAKTYCEQIIPRVENYKREHGIYPKDINDIKLGDKKAPRLLQKFGYYNSDGTNYRFDFPDPGDMLGVFGYDNSQKEWDKYD